jgi:membrane dipeptidase
MPDPTFDFYPRGTPLLFTDRIEAAMEAALSAGETAGAALDIMEEQQVQLIQTDSEFRDTLQEAYAEAGVNLVSATMGSLDADKSYATGVREDLVRWQARIDALPWLRKATSPETAREIVADGDVGVVLNTQNLGLAIEGDVDDVDAFYNAGIRVGQLTYNSQNLVGHGCTERVDAGLSHHGVEVIERMNELGMVVDLSHCGRETTLDAVSVSEQPVAYTHTFCEALADHDRAKSETELERLRDNDGYVGVLAVPFFLEPGNDDAEFETFFEHVDRMVEIVGIDRVGIGTDWGSWTTEIPKPLHEGIKESFRGAGFREEHGLTIGIGYGPMDRYEDWNAIPTGLADRGYDKDQRRKILGQNYLDFWERARA